MKTLTLFAIVAVAVFAAGTGALLYRAATAPPYVQVAIVNYAFSPNAITVKAGTTVRWINMDFVAHTVSFGAHDNMTEGMGSNLLGHMGAYEYTFTQAGVYEYHCDPHPYMTGTVTVTA